MKFFGVKKMFSWVFIITITLTLFQNITLATDLVWDGQTLTEVFQTNEQGEDGEGFYLISNGAQLAWIAQQVNQGNTFRGKTVKLLDDIDLGQQTWTPIGTVNITEIAYDAYYTLNDSNAFEGIFDGNGKQILNLSISSGNGVGLFGYVTGTIKDVTVCGNVLGGYFVAGVAAIAGGEISGVVNEVTVSATGNCVGGILAEGLDGIQIKQSHNNATISNSSNTQGSGKVAGIVGCIQSGTGNITECSNRADIVGYQYVAGIVGGQFANVDISNCFNTGNITAISFGKAYLGGISGKCQGGTITNCYNRGNLYDAHWSTGHIRAIGGITGCEEQHVEGMAISNCYTTGLITVNTSNMTYGNNWIYMLGNISGGNSSTAENTMHYQNCFYLIDCIAVANPNHEDYRFWADVYKNNPLLWDTDDITPVTQEQLLNNEVIDCLNSSSIRFYADTDGINDGYPVLYWQIGASNPDAETHHISTQVLGGTADISINETTAPERSKIIISCSNLESKKQIKEVRVTDTAGGNLQVTTVIKDEEYVFSMPNRGVCVTVVLENIVDQTAHNYQFNLPDNLDLIWTVDVDSSYLTGSEAAENATVFVSVTKADGAYTSSLQGITVTNQLGEQVPVIVLTKSTDSSGSGAAGLYSFTMPSSDVTIALDIDYIPLEIYHQAGENGKPVRVATFSRQEMLKLAHPEAIYYSGYASETDPFIAKAQQAVTLTDLLKAAGLSMKEGDTLEVVAFDGMNLSYPYERLYGINRYYYPNLISGANEEEKAAGKTEIDAMFVIKGYLDTTGKVGSQLCDTLNAYRFVFGQSESEFLNHTKIVDQMPKCVSKIILKQPKASSSDTSTGGGGGGGGTTQAKPTVTTTGAGGKATVDANGNVTITVEEGYQIKEVLVNGVSKSAVAALTGLKSTDKVEIIFEEKQTQEEPKVQPVEGYSDAVNHWAKDSINFVLKQGLFNGMTKTQFAPDIAMTRGMLVTVLHRMAGTPKGGTVSFADVEAGQWYTDAVGWAAANKIVTGYTESVFGVEDNVTREQMVTILNRYAKAKGYERPTEEREITEFNDAQSVSEWAVEAMRWGIDVGLITGKEGNMLDPQGTATRAEVATILFRFVNLIDAND